MTKPFTLFPILGPVHAILQLRERKFRGWLQLGTTQKFVNLLPVLSHAIAVLGCDGISFRFRWRFPGSQTVPDTSDTAEYKEGEDSQRGNQAEY